MSFLSVRGLVIRSVPYKESDRIICILTQDCGILYARAPGAAKAKSLFCYATQPMMLCNFVLSKTRDYYYLREAEVIEAFQAVQEDIERMTAASHLFEIALDVCIDHESSRAIYPLLVRALFSLANNEKDYRLTVSVFEWKIPDLIGFSADLRVCACGEPNAQQYRAFSFTHCRLYCLRPTCLSKAGKYRLISPGCVDALVHIYSSSFDKLFSFYVSSKVLDEITEITRQYLSDRLEKNYNRMELLLDQPSWISKEPQTDPL